MPVAAASIIELKKNTKRSLDEASRAAFYATHDPIHDCGEICS